MPSNATYMQTYYIVELQLLAFIIVIQSVIVYSVELLDTTCSQWTYVIVTFWLLTIPTIGTEWAVSVLSVKLGVCWSVVTAMFSRVNNKQKMNIVAHLPVAQAKDLNDVHVETPLVDKPVQTCYNVWKQVCAQQQPCMWLLKHDSLETINASSDVCVVQWAPWQHAAIHYKSISCYVIKGGDCSIQVDSFCHMLMTIKNKPCIIIGSFCHH